MVNTKHFERRGKHSRKTKTKMKNAHYLVFHVDPTPTNGHKRTKTGIQYMPKHLKDYKEEIRRAAKAQWGARKILDDALKVEVIFHLSRPASISVKKRKYPCVKPDLDNLEKILYDSMEGVIYINDSRIVTKTVSKWYSTQGMIEVKVKVLK